MSDDPALDWLALDGDEEVLWTSHPHRLSLLPALAVGVPLSVVLIGIPIVVGAYLNYVNTDHVVTTSGVYKKTGVLSRDVQKIGFEKVQNISYTQSALGARVGYGTVEISTAGGSGVEMTFRSVPDPADVQELIDRRIDRGDGRDADGEDVLAEILAELRAIRTALEERPLAGASTGSTALASIEERAPDPDPEPSTDDARGDGSEDAGGSAPFEGADPAEDGPAIDTIDDPAEDG